MSHVGQTVKISEESAEIKPTQDRQSVTIRFCSSDLEPSLYNYICPSTAEGGLTQRPHNLPLCLLACMYFSILFQMSRQPHRVTHHIKGCCKKPTHRKKLYKNKHALRTRNTRHISTQIPQVAKSKS